MGIGELFADCMGRKIALYGLGTETMRAVADLENDFEIVGLLDGFREDGEMYGQAVISFDDAVKSGAELIIVVARPGSCKAITKRIGGMCRENGIALYDVRGKDLLETAEAAYDFSNVKGESKAALMKKIEEAGIVSFDLFDTLITRKVYSYTDIFELADCEWKMRGICIPDFAKLRLAAEKELSKTGAPTLEAIYAHVLRKVGGSFVMESQLAEMEWEIDFKTMVPRDEVCGIFRDVIASGKRVAITTDSYYRKSQIEQILDRFSLKGYERLIVSCEYGKSKMQGLFSEAHSMGGGKVLHIGDDRTADIEAAEKKGFLTYHLFSGADLLDSLGGAGIEDSVSSLSDRVKAGLFISRLFNSPFQFEEEGGMVSVADAAGIGYLFCAPIITDFVTWLQKRIKNQAFKQILFCARDGYLVGRLYRKADEDTKSIYFLTSRTAAIRAGVESEGDIAYVDSMKFSGSPEEALKVRFGIDKRAAEGHMRDELILDRAGSRKLNYRRYIEKLGLLDEKVAMFDFVAKGTVQLYLGRLLYQSMKGFYFLQLEPEFMADKGLDIEPFYSDEEKNGSAVFDNYYILETVLTSPYPQAEEFDGNGIPGFDGETRSDRDIRCIERVQVGIEQYFDDYIRLLPEGERRENKKLDEALLSLVNKVRILDEGFLALAVEDPFFGRVTDIKDVIG